MPRSTRHPRRPLSNRTSESGKEEEECDADVEYHNEDIRAEQEDAKLGKSEVEQERVTSTADVSSANEDDDDEQMPTKRRRRRLSSRTSEIGTEEERANENESSAEYHSEDVAEHEKAEHRRGGMQQADRSGAADRVDDEDPDHAGGKWGSFRNAKVIKVSPWYLKRTRFIARYPEWFLGTKGASSESFWFNCGLDPLWFGS